MDVRLVERSIDGKSWPVLVWAPGPGWRMVSTAVVGGGIGPREWWLNAKVGLDYDPSFCDPVQDVLGIARSVVGPACGDGVGMLTAADVTRWTHACVDGVEVVATVGIGLPVYACADDATVQKEHVGTINILVRVPVAMSDAALVNAVVTATEAKTQALNEAGVPGTGTASDAVCVACPQDGGTTVEEYGGPRSTWGLRVARAVHQAVAEGVRDWIAKHCDGDVEKRWPKVQEKKDA